MPSLCDNDGMFEILIRIEILCLESSPALLLGCGLGMLILGVLLWLAGSYFSAALLGLLGAFVGSVCGLLVSQWLGTSVLAGMTIGALVFTLAAVLFRNVLIILLATLVFGLAGATAYSTLILKETPHKSDFSLTPSLVQPFSQMDTSARLAYANQITEEGENFFERLRLLVKDTLQTVSGAFQSEAQRFRLRFSPPKAGLDLSLLPQSTVKKESKAVEFTAPCSEVLTVLGSLPSVALSSVRRA